MNVNLRHSMPRFNQIPLAAMLLFSSRCCRFPNTVKRAQRADATTVWLERKPLQDDGNRDRFLGQGFIVTSGKGEPG